MAIDRHQAALPGKNQKGDLDGNIKKTYFIARRLIWDSNFLQAKAVRFYVD